MSRIKLSNRQDSVACYIAGHLRHSGRPPSYAMIRDAFGYQDNTGVRQIIRRLEAKGILKREGKGRERRIKLVRTR